MRERLYRFMQGRNGFDAFSRFLTFVSLAVMLISSFTGFRITYYIGIAVFVWGYFRVFSRNIYRRSAENSKYLAIAGKVKGFFGRLFGRGGFPRGSYRSGCGSYYNPKDVYTPEYKIFKCPDCRQKLRVPKGKGKIQISCRRCGRTFIKRT